MYVTNTIRFAMAVIALENFTLLAALWPVAWAIGNGLFSIMLVIRRKQVKR